MSRRKLKYILVIILATLVAILSSIPQDANAQVIDGKYEDIYANDPNRVIDNPLDSMDGAKRSRPRKPLESFYFSDSTKNNTMFAWTFNPYNNDIDIVEVDTLIDDFYKDYFFLKENKVGVTYLGNLGAAVMPLNFNDRPDNDNLSFLDSYNEYLFKEDNVLFYNGRVPFTNFTFLNSGQRAVAEEIFSIIHQQNISPSTAINVSYRNNRTRGQYANQQSINKNLSLAVSHTGKRYSMHMGYIYNSGDIEENGGVIKDGHILDTLIDLTQNVEMNLNDAKNVFKGNVFYFTQSYAIPFISITNKDSILTVDDVLKQKVADGTALYFGTSFKYSAYTNVYTDTKEESKDDFYKNWYINPISSRDSIREREIDAKFFAQFQPYNRNGVIGLITAGVGYSNEKYYNFKPSDFLLNSKDDVRQDMYVYGDINGKYNRYLDWSADVKYTPFGHQSQDVSFGGNVDLSAYIKKRAITLSLKGRFKVESPTYWQESYNSNHYVWNESFDKETRLDLSVELIIPSIRLKLGATQNVLNNRIYFNSNSLPTQAKGAVSVTGAYIYKDFVIGGLHLEHNILLQHSSNQTVIPVPALAANLNYYYRFHVVKDVLELTMGLEAFYNTSFNAFGYNPATQQFYNQQSVETGNYPLVNVFVAGKWKRMRILLKYQHLNYELFGARNYMSAAHYPQNRAMFKFGFSWSFFD